MKIVEKDQQNEALIENVFKSVKTAQDILAHLEASLVRGGFEKGIPSYQKMCETLIGQKLWSSSFSNQELNNEFQKLSKKAIKIFETLAPYTEIMKKLSAISILEKDELVIDDSFKAILKVVDGHGGPISLSALRSKVKLNRKELKEKLETLEKKCLIVSKTSSGRPLYFIKKEEAKPKYLA